MLSVAVLKELKSYCYRFEVPNDDTEIICAILSSINGGGGLKIRNGCLFKKDYVLYILRFERLEDSRKV